MSVLAMSKAKGGIHRHSGNGNDRRGSWGPWAVVGTTWMLTILAAVYAGGQMHNTLQSQQAALDDLDGRLRNVESMTTEIATNVHWIMRAHQGDHRGQADE